MALSNMHAHTLELHAHNWPCDQQRTLASWRCDKHTAYWFWQSASLPSVPVHARFLSQICPVPSPKNALWRARESGSAIIMVIIQDLAVAEDWSTKCAISQLSTDHSGIGSIPASATHCAPPPTAAVLHTTFRSWHPPSKSDSTIFTATLTYTGTSEPVTRGLINRGAGEASPQIT